VESGIYTITSPSGNVYVGSTKNFKSRWSQHRSELRRSVHHSFKLQRAWNKYGEENMTFAVFRECPVENLIAEENVVIALLKPLYNCADIAGRPVVNEETRRKMSLSARGKPKSDAHRERISAAHKGKKKSPEHIAKIAKSRAANPEWVNTCAKISDALRGRPSGRKGIKKGPCPLTADERQKLGDAVSLKKNTSGYRGVSFNATRQLWKSVVRADAQRKFLGYFETKELAWSAICQHKSLHGHDIPE
jgi:group I intron endonuclease